jgi:hypothetical protein
MEEMPIVGQLRQLSRAKRKEQRARRRMLRKLGAGMQLCGAKTRSGRPCIMTALRNGRCRIHGGASKGPATPEGKAKALDALKRYWEKRKAEKIMASRGRMGIAPKAQTLG